MRHLAARWLPAAAFALGAIGAWPTVSKPKPAEAPAAEFSSARALAHIARFSREPRSKGSLAQRSVIHDLQATLAHLGFAAAVVKHGGLRNVEGHAPVGLDSGGVWLVAHSDSVRGSPGAGDDGLGLGVVMEAARALSVGGVPRSLHVLITDGEEIGLRGAEAHALAATERPRLVLNIEARGTSGPAYMFQTAGPTGELIDVLARSACRVQATSLARAVYEQLPNDTDFTVFRKRGWWGYDFAIIGGAWRYHTPEDTLENLDHGSVQQVGDCVVDLARAWLSRPLGDRDSLGSEGTPGSFAPLADQGPPVAYSQLFSRTFAVPAGVIRGLGLALLGGVAVAWRKAGRAGVGSFFLTPLLASALGSVLGLGPFLLPEQRWSRPAEMADPLVFFVAAYVLGLACAGACLAAARRASGAEADDGWSLATALLAGLGAVAWPVGGYVLLPAGMAALAFAVGQRSAAVVAAAVAGVVVGPVLVALPVALTTRMMPVLCVVPWLLVGFLVARPSWRRGVR